MDERRGHDWRPAAVVFGIVVALVAIPAILASVVPTRQTRQGPDATVTLSAPGESPDTIEFAGIAGWERRPTGDKTTAVLDGPGGTVLLVSVANGVADFGRAPDWRGSAADWRRKVLGLQAFPVNFDGSQIHGEQGFAGPTCRGVRNAGVCAILGNHNLVVSVLLSGGNASPAELHPIVNSMRARS